MDSFRNQIDLIKQRIKLSDELSKHINLISKGNDLWCLCFFHNEKTPSMKINDDTSSYYCFGCGAKGDTFSFYTDYLNYSFKDAVIELGKKAGVNIDIRSQNKDNFKIYRKYEILESASSWYHNNLLLDENNISFKYLKDRKISKDTIIEFKLGYTENKNINLYQYLLEKAYTEKELIESNLFKKNEDGKIRNFFYKRLIFPIYDYDSKIVGFGARSLDGREPKYLNSPESEIFKKGRILFNFHKAKSIARKKQNILVSEGYMDVISLFDKGIKSVVAPLGTSITYEQLMLVWKVCKLPTLIFDGDKAGKKASIKAALLALKHLKPSYSLKFLELPDDHDPDSFINSTNKSEASTFFKRTKDLSNFIFDYAKMSFVYETPDQKIVFDKYFDDITNLIDDKKVKFFYKKDFRNKLFYFFNKNISKVGKNNFKFENQISSLEKKEYLSFLAGFINHPSIRPDLIEDLIKFDFKDFDISKCFSEISKEKNMDMDPKTLIGTIEDKNILKTISKSLNIEIYQLFPYSSPNCESKDVLNYIKESIKIIETRLSNSLKIDKSLKEFKSDSSALKWNEFKNLSYDYIDKIDV
tara:strand:- start:1691 stop:3445 length:1755 start_codon:yes stop_codon:yes gene_type:complete